MVSPIALNGPFDPASTYLATETECLLSATTGNLTISISKGSGLPISAYTFLEFEYSRSPGPSIEEMVEINVVIPGYGPIRTKIPTWGSLRQPTYGVFLKERVRINQTAYATPGTVDTVLIRAGCRSMGPLKKLIIKNLRFGSATLPYQYISLDTSGPGVTSPPAGIYPIQTDKGLDVGVISPASAAITNVSIDGVLAYHPYESATIFYDGAGGFILAGAHTDGEWQQVSIQASGTTDYMAAKIETGRII
jgi:hypothetical protein